MNINTKQYWEERFGSGDWKAKGGFSQSSQLCESQIPFLNLPKDFTGFLVDFGCGAGDAFPIYKREFPNAKLAGIDISEEAIHLCRSRFGEIASFSQGDFTSVPECDIIIASNVLEHLDDDQLITSELVKRCKRLVIVVPFEEEPLCDEHVRTYSKGSFDKFNVVRETVFASLGWSEYGFRQRIVGVYIGNIFRYLARQPRRKRRLQILYEIACS